MTDRSISELLALTNPDPGDVLPIVNAGETKKITVSNLLARTHIFTVASALSLLAGTSTSVIADLQTLLDGNIYHVDEVVATPGFNLTLTFAGVTNIDHILVRFYYAGGTTHGCRFQIFNNATAAWDTLLTASGTALDHTLYSQMLASDTNYINGGQVLLRFYHTENGNASHDLYVDYVGVVSV